MAFRRLRLVRETIIELPQLRSVTNLPLVLRPEAPVAIVSEEVFNNEMIQYYLAQNALVEIGEDGAPVAPPAAPEIKSDAEKGEGPDRGARPAGANPEDGTRPRANVYPPPGSPNTGLSQTREERPAGANPEDGTRPAAGAAINPTTGQPIGAPPPTDPNAPTPGQPKPGEEPTSAIDEGSPQMQAAKTEADFRGALDETGNMKQPSGDATPTADTELASRRDESTMTTEGAPTPTDSTETSAETASNPDATKGSYGSTRKRR